MPKQKIPAVMNRMYHRVFICMRCNARMRTDAGKVKAGKVKCRKCGYKKLRPKSKEKRGAA